MWGPGRPSVSQEGCCGGLGGHHPLPWTPGDPGDAASSPRACSVGCHNQEAFPVSLFPSLEGQTRTLQSRTLRLLGCTGWLARVRKRATRGQLRRKLCPHGGRGHDGPADLKPSSPGALPQGVLGGSPHSTAPAPVTRTSRLPGLRQEGSRLPC